MGKASVSGIQRPIGMGSENRLSQCVLFHSKVEIKFTYRLLLTPFMVTTPTTRMLLPIRLKRLSELAPCPNRRPLPVKDVDRNHNQHPNTPKQCTSPLEMKSTPDILIHRR